MKISIIFPSFTVLTLLILMSIDHTGGAVVAQEPIFELPVQLVGFPVIILAVRFSNFVKKLAYSVNPKTYQARTRRSSSFHERTHHLVSSAEFTAPIVDVSMAEKRIIDELGPKACVLEEPCMEHALRPVRVGEQPDWNDILRNYKVQRAGMKQWYLLSVFLGDLIRDTSLCKRLAKRLQCDRTISKVYDRQH